MGWNERKNIPPRYAARLDDLRAWHVIVVTCPACGRRARISGLRLQKGRPPHTRLVDLERKLRCSGCGNSSGNTISVTKAPRD